MREYGISSGQWALLRQLWREDGISQKELSFRLALSDATVSVSLQAMEKSSLIYRCVNRLNRHEKLVFIAPKAKRLERALLTIAADIQSLATEGFSDKEIDILRSLLLRSIANLATGERDLPSGWRPMI
ncbi:MarR family winged helix-turn-helix transcriptional regulator [Parasphingorhabdus sp.]|uniref:MarR family winged helix-turn-helix transcriptional regulator n=1 Tax=Parasphingorhabdus sp. TaxID=2709688 RepID=UPI003A94A3D0